jgi:cell division septum initiation protein DivIVA
MDILHLVDRLETMLSNGWRIPFTSNVMVQEDAFLDLIDQMRISIPDEVKQARRIGAERERLLEQAQQEADRVVSLAQDQLGHMTSDEEVVKLAKSESDGIVAEAYRSAEVVKADADAYVMEVLSEMEEQLLRLITTVRNGIQQVEHSVALRGREARSRKDTGEGQREASPGEDGA